MDLQTIALEKKDAEDEFRSSVDRQVANKSRVHMFHPAVPLLMAPPTTVETVPINTIPAPAPSSSRSRPQSRKRLPNDDAGYFGPSASAGTKRPAERADGEPRLKRKRVEASGPVTTSSTPGNVKRAEKEKALTEGAAKLPLVNFEAMPLSAIYRYLTYFDLVPTIHPSPLTAHDPPTPSSLANPPRPPSRAPSPPIPTTPANRPRREPRDTNRRRSSRLLEEDFLRTPILADVQEVHTTLAGVAERHFQQYSVKEVDTLATFLARCKVAKALA